MPHGERAHYEPQLEVGFPEKPQKKVDHHALPEEALAEIRMLTDQMKRLLKNIEKHPDKYFRFSLF